MCDDEYLGALETLEARRSVGLRLGAGLLVDLVSKPLLHIPRSNSDKSYCGRRKTSVLLINTRLDASTFDDSKPEDSVDNATCKVCGRVDDADLKREFRKSDEYKRDLEEQRAAR